MHQQPASAALRQGLGDKISKVGIGRDRVHTPEFSFEKQQTNVEAALGDLHISYPVVIVSSYRI